MNILSDILLPDVVKLLQSGAVGVIRTDTLYGIVARADDEQAVNRVYHLKDRDETKSPIVLIAGVDQLYDAPADEATKLLQEVWPGKVSIILPSVNAPAWIKRGNDSVAYRLPADTALTQLASKTGTLIAPSANPESHVPAMSIDEAIDYFGDQVDFYVDGGTVLDDTPSKLIRMQSNGNVERLR